MFVVPWFAPSFIIAVFLNIAPFTLVSTVATKHNSTGNTSGSTIHVIVFVLLSNVYVKPNPVVIESWSTVRPIGTVSDTVMILAVVKSAMVRSLAETSGEASKESPESSYI